jgi:hypothetical protein
MSWEPLTYLVCALHNYFTLIPQPKVLQLTAWPGGLVEDAWGCSPWFWIFLRKQCQWSGYMNHDPVSKADFVFRKYNGRKTVWNLNIVDLKNHYQSKHIILTCESELNPWGVYEKLVRTGWGYGPVEGFGLMVINFQVPWQQEISWWTE